MKEKILQYLEKEKTSPVRESPNLAWEKAHTKVSCLSTGWFALSRLGHIRDYWFNALPLLEDFQRRDRESFSAEILIKEAQRFKERAVLFKLVNETTSSDLLLPFYCSFGLDGHQCLDSNWHPNKGVENVLCRFNKRTVLDYWTRKNRGDCVAFSSFLDWLTFYME